MKKVLTITLIVALLMSLSVSVALASGSQNNNPGNQTQTKAPAQTQGSQGDAQATMNQFMARFEEGMLDSEALRTQSRAQLDEQSQLTEDCKLQLRTMNQAYLNMSEEERALCQDDIDALRSQIRAAHRYALEIDAAREQLQSRLQDCLIDGVPTETEVEETADILNEL